MTDFNTRYPALAHAVQSGVNQTLALNAKDIAAGTKTASSVETSPKMLRTGINMALVESSALAGLLIGKGIITLEEYQDALVTGLEAEVKKYETELSERMGTNVHLA